MKEISNTWGKLSPSFGMLGGNKGGELGKYYRKVSVGYKLFGKPEEDRQAAEASAAARQTRVDVLQRRQMADAEAERLRLAQEEASMSSRRGRRGRGLTQYFGG